MKSLDMVLRINGFREAKTLFSLYCSSPRVLFLWGEIYHGHFLGEGRNIAKQVLLRKGHRPRDRAL